VELRQLRYFVTLAEELHFGRAAAREHIVQSALSLQIQRLERELGVTLLERNTHVVRLTRAGDAFLLESRGVLRAVERAVVAARQVSADAQVLRVAVGDPSLDSMPQVLRNLQYNHPSLVVHRIEASVPEQYRMLAAGTLDVGVGGATHAPAGVAAEVFRLDVMGVLLATAHRLAGGRSVPVRGLQGELLLLGEDARAPEFNEFVADVCERAGFVVARFPGSVQSVRAAAHLVGQRQCVAVVPRSSDLRLPGIRWLPLEPVCLYPWSLLWRAADDSAAVQAVRDSARALSEKLGWMSDRPHH
jgi:DNA-binding transcriptional LysR family regulator